MAYLSAFVLRRIPAGASWVEAEDVVQETLLAALGSTPEGLPDGAQALRRWMVGIARNKLREALRGARRRSACSFDAREACAFEPALASPDLSRALWEEREELARLLRALNRMPERDRRVLTLRYLEGRSWADVAERLGLPSADAARKLQQRARAKLLSRMEREGGG